MIAMMAVATRSLRITPCTFAEMIPASLTRTLSGGHPVQNGAAGPGSGSRSAPSNGRGSRSLFDAWCLRSAVGGHGATPAVMKRHIFSREASQHGRNWR
jgi:hypothetical protein